MLVHMETEELNIICIFLVLSDAIEFFCLKFVEALAEEASARARICDGCIRLRYPGLVHENFEGVVHVVLGEIRVLCHGGDRSGKHAGFWSGGRSRSDIADRCGQGVQLRSHAILDIGKGLCCGLAPHFAPIIPGR